MLKVVLDTNVLVSALLKPDSTPELVVSLILEDFVLLCMSPPVFNEYQEVLNREKFRRLDRNKMKAFLVRLKAKARWVEPKVHLDIILSDPEDNRFLECAVEAQADFLITGNTKHFPFKRFKKAQITTPAEFLAVFSARHRS